MWVIKLVKENSMKTAVEWFNEEINKLNVGNDARVFIAKLFKQAKEMEKEQIKRAFIQGEYNFYLKNAEQYYNKTFKSE
jgi:hypothetical protein